MYMLFFHRPRYRPLPAGLKIDKLSIFNHGIDSRTFITRHYVHEVPHTLYASCSCCRGRAIDNAILNLVYGKVVWALSKYSIVVRTIDILDESNCQSPIFLLKRTSHPCVLYPSYTG